MHLTLAGPWGSTDLEAPRGSVLGELLPELEGTELTCDGRPVRSTDVVGQPPLLPGAVLTAGRSAPDVAMLAAAAPWHVALQVGAHAGACLPPWCVHPGRRTAPRWRRKLTLAGGVGRWRRRPPPREPEEFSTGPLTARRRQLVARIAPIVAMAAIGVALAVAMRSWYLLALPLFASLGLLTTFGDRGPKPDLPDGARATLRSAGPGRWTWHEPAAHRPAGLELFGRPRPPGHVLAIVGTREHVLNVARAVIGEAVTDRGPHDLRLAIPAVPQWAWCRWLPHAGPTQGSDATRLDVMETWPGGADRAPAPRRDDAVMVVLADEIPANADAIVPVRQHRGRTQIKPARRWRTITPLALPEAELLARRLAAAAAAPDVEVPAGAADLLGIPAASAAVDAIARAWRRGGLLIPTGRRSDGTMSAIDLRRAGPHALVAGVTGSGKSEFLRTAIVSLCLQQPPDRLTVIGIDFKGGSTFSALSGLPHLADVLTDLDVTAVARGVPALRAELQRREELLAACGARDIDEYWLMGRALPRLLLVVDEFRALSAQLPDYVDHLVDLAARGRSLGFHLVLATQRPAGAVGPELRANLTLRVAFRLLDGADSSDVIGSSAAARLPAESPGFAIVQDHTGDWQPRRLPRLREAAPRARIASWPERWHDAGPQLAAAGANVLDARVRELVDATGRAAESVGLSPARPPWPQALPTQVTAAQLVRAPDGSTPLESSSADGHTARERSRPWPLGLADLPHELAQRTWSWSPRSGHLAIVGAPASGRSTIALAVAITAIEHGHAVHVIARDVAPFAPLAACGHPLLGTIVDARDPVRLRHLAHLLGSRPPDHDTLLVLDDAIAVQELDGSLDRGDLPLAALLAAGGHLACVVTGPPQLLHSRLAQWLGERIVLRTTDPTDDLTAGVPVELRAPRPWPGRGVWLGAGRQALCQLALPDLHAVTEPPARGQGPEVAPGPEAASTPEVAPTPIPARLAALPERVPAAAASWDGARLTLGVGGWDAQPTWLDLPAGGRLLLVGTGDHDEAATLAGKLLADGGAGPISIDGEEPGAGEALAQALAADRCVLLTACGSLSPDIPPLPATGRLVAAADLEQTLGAFRGPLAQLRRARHGIVFSSAAPGLDDVFSVPIRHLAPPASCTRAGDGVLVAHGRARRFRLAGAGVENWPGP